jgi:predicted nucleotidyltransferase
VPAVYLAKDFIQTKEGLIFAIVAQEIEQGKVLCFLRYMLKDNVWQKLNTTLANQLLSEQYPQYLFYSAQKSAHLHAVDLQAVVMHHQPKQRLQALLVKQDPDVVEQDLLNLCHLLRLAGIVLHDVGVTGSLLIGAQNPSSDIDLVVYDRNIFHYLRKVIAQLITENKLQSLDAAAWRDSYNRRQCDLSYADYVWHEQRKYNKALINGRKFDLNLLAVQVPDNLLTYEKQGHLVMQAQVSDAQYAFDYPARFQVRHAKVAEVVCYTATYTGQAEVGEVIEVAGQLEVSNTGLVRILVGSTREAEGEYIKVIAT